MSTKKECMRTLPHLLSVREKGIALFFAIVTLISGGYLIAGAATYFADEVPTHGGTLREGVIGIPRFINPLLAISDADRDLSALVYTGLTRFDGQGGIVPALAERYEISEDGTVYTFTLHENLVWSDGKPLTAQDVFFTITLAKNPAYRSLRRANWEGVTPELVDDRTIRFILEQPYAPFLENTTLGILPRHIWRDVLAEEFHLTERNTYPIGNGPYTIESFEKNSSGRITQYHLRANSNAILPPFIKKIKLYFFASENELFQALDDGTVDSVSSLPAHLAGEVREKGNTILQLNLPRIFGVFFNQNTSGLLSDITVRTALEKAVDKDALVREVLKNEGFILHFPIPPGTLGAISEEAYNDDVAYDRERARELLADDGWVPNEKDGVLEKKKD